MSSPGTKNASVLQAASSKKRALILRLISSQKLTSVLAALEVGQRTASYSSARRSQHSQAPAHKKGCSAIFFGTLKSAETVVFLDFSTRTTLDFE